MLVLWYKLLSLVGQRRGVLLRSLARGHGEVAVHTSKGLLGRLSPPCLGWKGIEGWMALL